MKKILSTIALITFVAVAAKAQFQQGTKYVGGLINYTSYKTNAVDIGYATNSHKQLDIAPTAGIFLTSNFTIGLTPTYSFVRDNNYNSSPYYLPGNSVESHMLGGSLELRYYFKITERFAFYPALAGTYLTKISSTYYQTNDYYAAALTPNFVFFATPKLGINMGVGAIQWSKQKQSYKNNGGSFSTNSFNASANTGGYLGVSYYFN